MHRIQYADPGGQRQLVEARKQGEGRVDALVTGRCMTVLRHGGHPRG